MKGRVSRTVLGGAVLVVLVLLAYRELIQNLGLLREGEDANNVPWLRFIVAAFRDGFIPLWNPYLLGGFSMTTPGSWHQAMYYPMVALRAVVPFEWVDSLQNIVHIAGAGLFVLLLARRHELSALASTTSAVTFSLCGYLWVHAIGGNDWYVLSGAYLPAIIYFADRYLTSRYPRELLLCGAMVGLQLLAGQVQIVFYTLLGLATWVMLTEAGHDDRPRMGRVLRSMVLLLGSVTLIGGLLAAVAYLPYVADGQATFRTAYFSFASSIYGAVRPYELFGAWLLPWRLEMFVGSVAVLLAFLAMVHSRHPARMPFAGVAAVGLVLALGQYTPVHYVLYGLVPGFKAFRNPDRALILFAFGVAMLAGLGLDALQNHAAADRPRRLTYWKLLGVVSVVLLVGAVVGVIVVVAEVSIPAIRTAFATLGALREQPGGADTGDIVRRLYTALDGKLSPIFSVLADLRHKATGTTAPLALVLGAALIACTPRLRPSYLQAVKVVLLALIVYETAQFNALLTSRGTRFFDYAVKYGADKPITAFLRSDPELFRVALDLEQKAVAINEPMVHRLSDLKGTAANVPLRYHRYLLSLVEGGRVQVDPHGGTRQVPDFPFYSSVYAYLVRSYDSPLLDILNTKYVVTSRELDPLKYRRVLTAGDTHLFLNPRSFPRAWVVPNAIVVHGEDRLVTAMRSHPDFRTTVVLSAAVATIPPMASAPPTGSAPASDVVFESYEPNRIALRATTSAAGYLVLSESYHPAWRAFVDGKETPVARANYIMRALPLSQGAQSVVLVFDPPLVLVGRWISAVTWVIVLALIIGMTIRAGRRRPLETP